MSNLGRWNDWYDGAGQRHYGDTATYSQGGQWLAPCALIEDWGCGLGWMRRFVPDTKYHGLDEIVDLSTHRRPTPGLFMRHVLEHNWDWEAILDNALASYQERMFLALFTPVTTDPHLGSHFDLEPDAAIEGVPTLSLSLAVIERHLEGHEYNMVTVPSATFYGEETVLRITR